MTIDYTGEQLSSHFAYKNFGISGDSIIAFCGECNIEGDNLVDLEEYKNKEIIYSPEMLHFIIEIFSANLEKAVLYQHILTFVVLENLNDLNSKFPLSRKGNDIFSNNKKLTISIATISPVSSLIHFGININSKGVNYPTIDLTSLGIEPEELAMNILESFADEYLIIQRSTTKARSVD
jgi:hypothetical protein